jgi:hypothetical protein
MNWLKELFSKAFMPHGHCFWWRSDLTALHVISDGIIALSYFCLPVILYRYAKKRSDFVISYIFYLFAAFIFFCGVTHVFDIIVIWQPYYWIQGFNKLFTAFLSCGTVFMCVFYVKEVILSIPSRSDFEKITQEVEREKKLSLKLKEELGDLGRRLD